MTKPNLLIVTTKEDLSLALLLESDLLEVRSIIYDKIPSGLPVFDLIYFRDPFNDPSLNIALAKQNTERLLKAFPQARSLDGVKSFDDMYFEDKLAQYKKFPNLMPKSHTLSLNIFDPIQQIIKKRISARSKDIIFSAFDLPPAADPTDYLMQSKLTIKEEFRAYVVGGKLMKPLAIKTSKTPGGKVRLSGLASEIPTEVNTICQEVYAKTHFDLMGLDIANTNNGFSLLETNRSCQFSAYERLSATKIADRLYKELLKREY